MLDLLYKRRSIRKYKNKKIEEEKKEKLIEALLLSPSSRNIRPWEFIIVENKENLKKLSLAKEAGSKFLEKAAMAVVVIGEEAKCDTWIEDCSIACTILQLEAESLGLGSCWIQIRMRKNKEGKLSEDVVKDILHIPNNLRVEAIIALGYPDEIKAAYSKNLLNYNKIRKENYKDI